MGRISKIGKAYIKVVGRISKIGKAYIKAVGRVSKNGKPESMDLILFGFVVIKQFKLLLNNRESEDTEKAGRKLIELCDTLCNP